MRTLTMAALMLLAPLAHADDNAEKVREYRHEVMEALGASMKMSAMIAKSEVSRADDMAAHASNVMHYAKLVKGLFPDGTGPDKIKTDAKPEVWSDRAGFDKAADEFVAKAEAWVKATESGDAAAAMQAFGAVGKTCGGCHDGYKVDDDH